MNINNLVAVLKLRLIENDTNLLKKGSFTIKPQSRKNYNSLYIDLTDGLEVSIYFTDLGNIREIGLTDYNTRDGLTVYSADEIFLSEFFNINKGEVK